MSSMDRRSCCDTVRNLTGHTLRGSLADTAPQGLACELDYAAISELLQLTINRLDGAQLDAQ